MDGNYKTNKTPFGIIPLFECFQGFQIPSTVLQGWMNRRRQEVARNEGGEEQCC